MPRWTAFSSDHEFSGQILIDLANAARKEEIFPYFEKHGFTNIDPKGWYPMQQLLDVYNDIQADSSMDNGQGTMLDFVSIGMKQIERATIPPDIEPLPLLSMLQSAEQVFRASNRGTNIGDVNCEVVTDKHVKMILHVSSPDNLWYGIMYGYARRFLPKHTMFTVYFDKDTPRRDEGNDVTIIHIDWE